MSNERCWTIEAHDRSGQVFVYVRSIPVTDVTSLLGALLNDSKTGGIVIYRPTKIARSNDKSKTCKYCLEIDGHNADCPTIS